MLTPAARKVQNGGPDRNGCAPTKIGRNSAMGPAPRGGRDTRGRQDGHGASGHARSASVRGRRGRREPCRRTRHPSAALSERQTLRRRVPRSSILPRSPAASRRRARSAPRFLRFARAVLLTSSFSSRAVAPMGQARRRQTGPIRSARPTARTPPRRPLSGGVRADGTVRDPSSRPAGPPHRAPEPAAPSAGPAGPRPAMTEPLVAPPRRPPRRGGHPPLRAGSRRRFSLSAPSSSPRLRSGNARSVLHNLCFRTPWSPPCVSSIRRPPILLRGRFQVSTPRALFRTHHRPRTHRLRTSKRLLRKPPNQPTPPSQPHPASTRRKSRLHPKRPPYRQVRPTIRLPERRRAKRASQGRDGPLRDRGTRSQRRGSCAGPCRQAPRQRI